MVKAATLEELAEKTHIPFQQLKATVDEYNADAKAGTDSEFKKTTAFAPINPPYYAVPSTIVRYKTNGGLDINANCEVVDRGENVIPNLYAAGHVPGPNHAERSRCVRSRHAQRVQKMAAALQESLTQTTDHSPPRALHRSTGGGAAIGGRQTSPSRTEQR